MPEDVGGAAVDEYAESRRIMWLMGLAGAALLAALGLALAFIVRPEAPKRWPRDVRRNEAAVIAAMRTYAGAQNIFHRTDYDSDGILEYAGPGGAGTTGMHDSFIALYGLTVAGMPIELIPKEMADAKHGTFGSVPYCGYYFSDIEEDCSGIGYNATFTYGLCAVPAEHGVTGINTFVIDVQGTVYQFDNGGKVLSSFPDTANTSATWIVSE